MAEFNDPAGSMGSWKTSVSSKNGYTAESRKTVDDLFDYKVAKDKKYIQERSKIYKTEKKLTQKQLDDYIKANLSASAQVKKAWSKTGLGSFLSDIKEYKKLASDIKSQGGMNAANAKKVVELADNIGSTIGSAVKKAIDLVVQQYSKYAKSYESYLSSTSASLGLTRGQYSDKLQSTNKSLFQNGLGSSVSMTEIMSSMDSLAKSGISSNLEALSTLQAMSDRISTTWDPSTIMDQLRVYGNNSGIFELSMGSEAMLRDTLQAQFGDSQYINSGMYKATKASLQVLLQTQKTAEQSAEFEYAIQEGVGTLVEAGMSQESSNTIQGVLKDLATKGYTTNAGALKAMSEAGVSPSAFANGTATKEDYQKFLKGYGSVFSDYKTDNTLAAYSIGQSLGGYGTQDFKNADKINAELDKMATGVVESDDIYKYLDQETEEAKKRKTMYESIDIIKENSIGIAGGNKLGQAGSGLISGVGSLLGAGAGLVAGGLTTKFLGSKLLGGASGGSGILSSLLGLGSKSVGGASSTGFTGLAGKFLTKAGSGGVGAIKGVGFTAGAKALGGVGAALGMGVDGYKAIKNKTYGDSGAANFFGGAFLGNSDGSTMGNLKNVGTNALKGAGVGMMFGPIGAAIGAGVGGLLGIIGNAVSKKKKSTESSSSSETVGTTTTSTSDTASVLNTINNSINVQTDKLVAVLTNMYKLIDTRTAGNGAVRAAGVIK